MAGWDRFSPGRRRFVVAAWSFRGRGRILARSRLDPARRQAPGAGPRAPRTVHVPQTPSHKALRATESRADPAQVPGAGSGRRCGLGRARRRGPGHRSVRGGNACGIAFERGLRGSPRALPLPGNAVAGQRPAHARPVAGAMERTVGAGRRFGPLRRRRPAPSPNPVRLRHAKGVTGTLNRPDPRGRRGREPHSCGRHDRETRVGPAIAALKQA